MNDLLKLSLFLFLLCCQGCVSIPKIQEGGFVDKINAANVQLKNGQNLKTVKNKKVEKTTIILVRHAEKMKKTKDPSLTKEGLSRADNLKNILSSTMIDHVFSTEYNRTQLTAWPTATSKNLSIQSYDPRKLQDFGKMLLEEYKGKTILVVGHSNTTPELMNYLMNEKVVKSIDESDYENLFIVNISKDDERKALLLKYQN